MTSTVRKCDRHSGFTLLEIVVALVIAGLVMSGAIGLMTFSSDEHRLKDSSTAIEALAKRARAAAIRNQTPYALELSQGMVKMMPWAEAGGKERSLASGRRIGGDDVPEAGERSQVALDSDMGLAVRRWNARGWDELVKRVVHVWRFDPDGLCEPLSLRLELNDSAVVTAYHPLTASIRDTQQEAR